MATETTQDQLYRLRHSLAHVLAQAVLELRPNSTLGFGPPIADGFYYDFILSEPIIESDFPELERRMKRIPEEPPETFIANRFPRTRRWRDSTR